MQTSTTQQLKRDYQGTVAIAQRILLELWRRKVSLICWVVFPASILVVNGLILTERGQLSTGEAFAQSVPPCLVGTALFFSCLGGSIATIVAEREQRTLKQLLISPLRGMAYFLGIFLAYGMIGVGQTLLVYAIAAFTGATFEGSVPFAALIIGLSMMAYVGTGFFIGAKLARRTEDVNALIAALGVPLLLLSGAFIPINFFPEALRNIAHYNPIYHMIEALAAASVATIRMADLMPHLWFLVGFTILTVAAGWLAYREMLHRERRS
ncbi:MAG: ABC transporter permease [Lyngbya sp. HA4199-MV5]|jgi:ABC-2 type transport system permease protein|nr:ABC transporter permease [Lyngbya sp. HA4199-MV5]